MYHPESTMGQRVGAGAYANLWLGAHLAGGAGLGMLAWEAAPVVVPAVEKYGYSALTWSLTHPTETVLAYNTLETAVECSSGGCTPESAAFSIAFGSFMDYPQGFLRSSGTYETPSIVFEGDLPSIESLDLARVSDWEALDTYRIAKEAGVQDLYVTGRTAASDSEIWHRIRAAQVYDDLVQSMGMDSLEAAQLKELVATEFQLEPYQVKVPTFQSEVDVYIPPEQWDSLSSEAQGSVTEGLMKTYGVQEVDFYQQYQDYPPPGAVHFDTSRGTIAHEYSVHELPGQTFFSLDALLRLEDLYGE